MPLDGQQLKPRDVARLLWDNGWVNADNLMVMLAVCQAESALFTEAWNLNTNGSYDYGIFQLNSAKLQGSQLDAFREMAFDPKQAVLRARSLYNERKFQPWYAYQNGAYKAYIPQACLGVQNMLRVLHGLDPI